jgi:hypothetical protein
MPPEGPIPTIRIYPLIIRQITSDVDPDQTGAWGWGRNVDVGVAGGTVVFPLGVVGVLTGRVVVLWVGDWGKGEEELGGADVFGEGELDVFWGDLGCGEGFDLRLAMFWERYGEYEERYGGEGVQVDKQERHSLRPSSSRTCTPA